MREVSFVGETVIDLGELEKRSDLHSHQLIGKCAYLAPNLYNQSNDGQIVIGCNDGTLIIFDDYHGQNSEAAPHIIRDYRGNIAKITSFLLNQIRWLLVLYSVGVGTIKY